MKKVNVLVTASSSYFAAPGIGDENLSKIAALDSRIKLDDASILLSEEQKKDFSSKERFDALLSQAEVILARRLPQDVLKRTPNLKWIQIMSAGVDRFLSDKDMVASPVTMTNASGIHAVAISEWVLGVMLMFAKDIPRYLELKRERKWQRSSSSVIYSQTVGIIGLGHIGREVAKRAKALGMHVIATRRSARKVMRARYVDRLLPGSQQDELLRESDFVVITLPLTPETKNLIGEKELRKMKPSAYLMNIGRGSIIDEVVLARALSENWIKGAGLDVFATEPLPSESELWAIPNLIITPHVSGSIEENVNRVTELFCDNLRRYMSGGRLFNVVDKKKGY